jgi:hypothetical protein
LKVSNTWNHAKLEKKIGSFYVYTIMWRENIDGRKVIKRLQICDEDV